MSPPPPLNPIIIPPDIVPFIMYSDGFDLFWRFDTKKQINTSSDFITNSCGESLDLSCEKIASHNPELMSPSSKNNESSLENAWAFIKPGS